MLQEELRFVLPEAPAPGEWHAVIDGIHWARIPLPFWLDHVNVWLLDDGDGWAIVDCGIDSPDVRVIWDRLLASLPAERPVRRLIATHGHTDHVGCAGYLQERLDVPFQATLIEWLFARLRHADHHLPESAAVDAFLRRHGCDETMAHSFREERSRVSRYLGPQPAVLERIRGGDLLDIGGRSWRVIIGRGHCEEHASFYCAADGVLLAGDQILPRITPVVSVPPHEPAADPLGDYLASFEAFAPLAEDTILLPGHGLPFQGLRPRIRSIIEHHEQRLRQLEQAIERPTLAFEAARILFRRAVEGGHGRLALGETLAHLRRLMKEERADMTEDRFGRLLFQARSH